MTTLTWEPILTDEMISSIFVNLVTWEVFGTYGQFSEESLIRSQFEGMQTGYIRCLLDMFGESSDASVEAAYDKGISWVNFVERIILTPAMKELVERTDWEHDEPDGIETEVERIAEEFIAQHIEDARTAIRVL